MSDESTSRQKSLVLSLPSSRRRRRVPIIPITVAMHTEFELRGSRASSFIPALKSLVGGIRDCLKHVGEAAMEEVSLRYSSQLNGSLDLSRAEPAVMLLRLSFFSSF